MQMKSKKSTEKQSGMSLEEVRYRLVFEPPEIPFDGAVVFRRGLALSVPQGQGVYLIWDLRGVLYVGRASVLRRRYFDHLEYSHNLKLRRALLRPLGQSHFGWLLDNSPASLERKLIRELQPLCNDLLYSELRDEGKEEQWRL